MLYVKEVLKKEKSEMITILKKMRRPEINGSKTNQE